ncbi:DUF1697 domain-containing protein [Aeromicrobium sp. UC242_57]|uniref:DUF1697 domain-containing protein n=1 Tax=Aeromicrobium sp. UC242_57 TaxID=3374624 RepID=UPI00379EC65C
MVGAGGIGFDVSEFLLHEPDESLEHWMTRWGVTDPALERGGLATKVKAPPTREVYLLQRKSTELGKGLGKTSGWVHRQTLKDSGVTMIKGATYDRIDDDGLHITVTTGKAGSKEEVSESRVLDVETVVLCTGQESVRDLIEPLQALGKPVHVIGGADVAAELDAKRAIKQATERCHPLSGDTGRMSVRIILLRAVNVGGAKLPMADLREIASDLGATDVSTYIASGNLVADVPGDPATFDRALEQANEKRFGFFREVISRTPEQVRAALAAHPFEVIEPKYSYVSFLTGAPTAAAIAKAETYETFDDDWQVIGSELHIRYANGAGRPAMKSDSIGRALGVPGTARNLNTVKKLIELAG